MAARELASAQRPPAQLTDCRIDGDDVIVRTTIPIDLGLFGVRAASAQARAGPLLPPMPPLPATTSYSSTPLSFRVTRPVATA